MQTNAMPRSNAPHTLVKVGAALFFLWGFLHLWVGFEGLHQYIVSPAAGQWKMFIGGANAPVSRFQFPHDVVTAHVHANLILNFCLDIAGYGLLGWFVAWQLFKRPSWTPFLIGTVLIGVCDISFTFLQVIPGIIEPKIPTVSGPIIWILAVIATFMGLRRALPA